VFLDISWIKKKIPNAENTSNANCRACITSLKQLADIDITKEPMEVGPTTHYIMGGVRRDADTQMSRVPGLFAPGECAAGINGANRLGGNSLSDLFVFGKRPENCREVRERKFVTATSTMRKSNIAAAKRSHRFEQTRRKSV
jgi:succinate dehydrogenase / fumarate reductase flavoprotein subunit